MTPFKKADMGVFDGQPKGSYMAKIKHLTEEKIENIRNLQITGLKNNNCFFQLTTVINTHELVC
jgi:hypothetical protein